MHAAADGGGQQSWAPPPDLRLVGGSTAPPDHRPHAPRADDEIVALYRREYQGIARLAFLLVGDRHRAEDLAPDAFVKLYEHWDSIEDHAKALAYLRVTTSNLAMSAHRRSKVARNYETSPVLSADRTTMASAESEALARSARPDVVAALQLLSPKQRTAVVLRHWLRLTESEIAEALDCSIGSTRTHLFRGHAALAKKLGGHR